MTPSAMITKNVDNYNQRVGTYNKRLQGLMEKVWERIGMYPGSVVEHSVDNEQMLGMSYKTTTFCPTDTGLVLICDQKIYRCEPANEIEAIEAVGQEAVRFLHQISKMAYELENLSRVIGREGQNLQ